MTKPKLLITLGDVAGVGPEIVARAWPELTARCHPVVVGDRRFLPSGVECVEVPTADLSSVRVGQVSATAGRAAYDWLRAAIRMTMDGEADGIVTCPLHKEGLHAAGVPFPGHTEILAHETGAASHAMVLWGDGLAVAHVTLHMALRDVFASITPESVHERIVLLHGLIPRLTGKPARIGVAALNPHGSDGGLFGDEEARLIAPAVERARAEGIDASGPWPADTLFVRAHRGEFDGIVAMYHDEGHIAMKLRSGMRCV
ncbi:MAG: 4-hydroxythreonine-4-phosphate dehydrogenase PdxA, partial [Gemmataceae bacterium]|nr:4-hydroxythreonine-4-phosphate dehydrogenase PdxA [Gemmataceae bacterium]